MPPPARFVIENEHLDGLADHPGVSSGDGVLQLIDAHAAVRRGRSGRRALASAAAAALVASVAVGLTLIHPGSPQRERLDKPARTADMPAVVVGGDELEARDRGRADDRSR